MRCGYGLCFTWARTFVCSCCRRRKAGDFSRQWFRNTCRTLSTPNREKKNDRTAYYKKLAMEEGSSKVTKERRKMSTRGTGQSKTKKIACELKIERLEV